MFVPRARWVARAAVVCLPTVVLSQRDKQPIKKPEVTQLTVTGMKAFTPDELSQNLAIEQSRCRSFLLVPICKFISKAPAFYERAYLDHDELARDVIRARVFYYLRGYRETTVDTVVRPAGRNAVRVTLAVHEGPPTVVSGVRVTQTREVLRGKELQSRLAITAGEPLNVFQLDSTRVRLRDRLWEKGFADAVIDTATVVDSAARRAEITITIDPRWIARVASVEVRGNQQVTTPTILKSLSLHPGDVFRRSDLLESQRALYESNLFRRASIQTPRQRGDSLKTVTVTVQEAPPRLLRLSAGFNTVDFAQVEGRYTDYNWFGGGRQLTALVTVGNLFARQLNGNGVFYDVSQTVVGAGSGKYFLPTFEASGEVQQPWVGSPKNSVALGLFTHRRIAPGIYVDRGYGTSATFTRMLGVRSTASVSYRFEVTNVDAGDVYFCVSYGVCDTPTLDALRKNQQLSPLALSISRDRTDDPYEPRRGYRARVDAEHASSFTLSDFRYHRIVDEESGFLPIGKRSVFGGHVQFGYVHALASTAEAVGTGTAVAETERILHPRKRFYLGGSASVRGYAENQLGPRVLTIAPEKLRGNPAKGSAGTCSATTPLAQCNPNASYISNNDFDARPLGGNALAEGSVEYRFPVFGSFLGAVFVDAGYLSQNTNPTLAKSAAAVTPGFGVRYLSPAGPIRVDVGINPRTSEQLPVVTEDIVNGRRTLVTLAEHRTFETGHGLLSRLMLHLAIGEAY